MTGKAYNGAWVSGALNKGLSVTGNSQRVTMATGGAAWVPRAHTFLSFGKIPKRSTLAYWANWAPNGDNTTHIETNINVINDTIYITLLKDNNVDWLDPYMPATPYKLPNSPNGWDMIATTYNGEHDWKFYVNAVVVASTTTRLGSMNDGYYTTTSFPCHGNTINTLWGTFDETAVFNRPLSQGEIQKIYQEFMGRHSNVR